MKFRTVIQSLAALICLATDAPRELTFVADDAIWGEAAGFREADTFGHDPVDDWYRQQPDDGPRELTYVDEDTFWSEF